MHNIIIVIQKQSFNISDGINGSATSYTIKYINIAPVNICLSDTILPDFCGDGYCRHQFNIVQTSECKTITDMIVNVSANNTLGAGPVLSSQKAGVY